MNKYSFEVSIEAATQQEAEVKLKAVATLIQKLKTNELVRLAEFVRNDPVKTALAKKYLGL
jgi:hypothetical protein